MAQRATDLAKNPRATKANRVGSVKRKASERDVEMRAIPPDLAPLLAPYKKRGRMTLRIERLPPLSRLSQGRNNGDHSWSLASDEIEDLSYLVPENIQDEHTLAIRIIGLGSGAGNTIAVLDLVVSPTATGSISSSNAEQDSAAAPDNTVSLQEDARLRGLREDLATAKEDLLEREAELEQFRQEAEKAMANISKKKASADVADVADAQAAFKAELDERLEQAAAQAAAELHKTQEALKNEQERRIEEIETRAEDELRNAQDSWHQEAQDALLTKEKSWKAEEAARLVDIEAKLQEKNASALNIANARVEKAEAALKGAQSKFEAEILAASKSQAGTDANEAQEKHDKELGRLQSDCEKLQANLDERENALTQIQSEVVEARERLQHESRTTLLKAKDVWAAKEDARLAEAEAQWKKNSADALAEANTLREQAEAALTHAKAEAQAQIAAQTEANNGVTALHDRDKKELQRLQEEQTNLQAAISEREKELARLRTEAAQGVTAQDRAASALTRLRDEHAKLRSTVSEREAELRQIRTEAAQGVTTQDRVTRELTQLRDEHAKLQSTVSERGAKLTQLRTVAKDSTTARDRAVRELEPLRHELVTVKDAWSAQETELAQLRVQARNVVAGRSKDEKELGDLRNEYAKLQALEVKREKKYSQTRVIADDAIAMRKEENKELRRLRKEFSRLESSVSKREAELQKTRAALADVVAGRDERIEEVRLLCHERPSSQEGTKADVEDTLRIQLVDDGLDDVNEDFVSDTSITLRTNKAWSRAKQLEHNILGNKKIFRNRNVVVAAALAASLIIFLPLAALFMTGGQQASTAGAPTEIIAAASSEPQAPPVQIQTNAAIIGGVNFRAGPSAGAEIISTLPAGLQVEIVRETGNWALIRFAGAGAGAAPQEGWVFNSFLESTLLANTGAVAAISQDASGE